MKYKKYDNVIEQNILINVIDWKLPSFNGFQFVYLSQQNVKQHMLSWLAFKFFIIRVTNVGVYFNIYLKFHFFIVDVFLIQTAFKS